VDSQKSYVLIIIMKILPKEIRVCEAIVIDAFLALTIQNAN